MREYADAKWIFCVISVIKTTPYWGQMLKNILVNSNLQPICHGWKKPAALTGASYWESIIRPISKQFPGKPAVLWGVQKDNAARGGSQFFPIASQTWACWGNWWNNFYKLIQNVRRFPLWKLPFFIWAAHKDCFVAANTKAETFAALRNIVKEKVREVALFGASRKYLKKAWEGLVPSLHWHSDLRIGHARIEQDKKTRDVILLSPATSSFDQYANYENVVRIF